MPDYQLKNGEWTDTEKLAYPEHVGKRLEGGKFTFIMGHVPAVTIVVEQVTADGWVIGAPPPEANDATYQVNLRNVLYVRED